MSLSPKGFFPTPDATLKDKIEAHYWNLMPNDKCELRGDWFLQLQPYLTCFACTISKTVYLLMDLIFWAQNMKHEGLAKRKN